MQKPYWIALAALVVIGLSLAQGDRYIAASVSSNAMIVTDTWLWRTTIFHSSGCMD